MLRRAFGSDQKDHQRDQKDQRQVPAEPERDRAAAVEARETPRDTHTDAGPREAREGDEHMDRNTERSAATASGTGELNALLGKGSEFDGKLAFEGTVRIDGTFTGEITTSDMLIIGESAKVNAEVSCGTIVVHGEVNGNIKATQAVELHKPARVKGDVATPSLVVERGVVFEGRSKMEDLEDKIVPMRTVSGGED